MSSSWCRSTGTLDRRVTAADVTPERGGMQGWRSARAQVSSVGVRLSKNRRGSRACPPWWVDRRGGTQCPSLPRRFDPDFQLDPPNRRYGFAAAPPAAEVAGSPLPLQPRRGAIPSASSAPKGRHPSAQGSALGAGHTPDSQPQRGAIAGRAVPMDCRYAAPAGLHLVLDSIPRALPWAEEWPRFQRSAASGIRDQSRRKSPSRVT